MKMANSTHRFRLDRHSDLALFNAIMLSEAHVARTGDVKGRFNSAYNMFCAFKAVTVKVESGVQNLS